MPMKKKRLPRKEKKALKGLRVIKHPLGLIVRWEDYKARAPLVLGLYV